VQEDEGGVTESVDANLLTHWEAGGDKVGGVLVSAGTDVVTLFGHVHKVFNLTRPIAVNKFTRLQCGVSVINGVDSVGICLYEDLSDASEENQDRCHKVQLSSVIDIAIGQLLNGKKTNIKFIGFTQDNNSQTPIAGEAAVSSISIIQGANTDIVDEDGVCKDPNARTIVSGDATVCMCVDGYVSSNGGKEQGPFDSCIQCILSPTCRFDGGTCADSDYCFGNACVGNKCEARVSLDY